MSDNVVILGAGASVDAGVPLLRNFVDKMWEIAIRGRIGDRQLEEPDREAFRKAIAVRDELNEYHGRAAFDDRNIEDILSLLTFNQLAGGRGTRTDIPSITTAIARTIELTCTLRHSGKLNQIQQEGDGIYRQFWRAFSQHVDSARRQLPALISFNYDLVLERAFLQTFVGTGYSAFESKQRMPFERAAIRYHYDQFPDQQFSRRFTSFNGPDFQPRQGVVLQSEPPSEDKTVLAIPLLKLHGSVNFSPPALKRRSSSPVPLFNPDFTSLPQAIDEPFILPPIFNKSTSGLLSAWKEALLQLREAKNVVIVGYSLPRTDIYMQYFLKSALGPNLNLNRVTVFNPVLYRGDGEAKEIESRYASCFAPQLHERIEFRPQTFGGALPGSFAHFVKLLEATPSQVFF